MRRGDGARSAGHGPAGWLSRAKQCPNCGEWTLRQRTPVLLRPVRWVLRGRASYRACRECGWQGLVIR
ncbi:MAG TPA: hypothetical protein VFQ38_17010 [Longimicrobiales bacterium]|nr:hypothetical protein [Longimicrobiales bacterium]